MAPKVSVEYKEDTREKILGAAHRLFQRRGYYETSMDDIVKESGLSKGAIYGYFASKEELFETLQGRENLYSIEQAERLASGEGTARAKLEKVADIYFLGRDEYAREACRMALEFSNASLRMKPVRKQIENQYSRIHGMLVSILNEGIKNGEFREGIDVDSIVALLIATVDGLMLRWATSDAQIDWKRERDALIGVVLEGISLHRVE